MPDNSESVPYDPMQAAPGSRVFKLSTPDASPPTPKQQLPGSPSLRTRSGTQRSTASQSIKLDVVKSGRIEKASPKKKPATITNSPPASRSKVKPADDDSKSIQQPLSVLSETWNIPQTDIGAYVARSEEVRLSEVEKGKVPGKVKRAMNAFMLYRKAYQDTAKKFAQQSNHQVVSKVCGQSWSMEPDAVRRQFNEWAVTERENHRKAHPEYKFTPSKPKKKGKEGMDDDSDAEVADWDHHTAHYGAGRGHMMDQHTAPYGYQYSTSHIPDMQSSYAAYQRPQHTVPSGLARHNASVYDVDEYGQAGSQYRQSPSASGHHQHNMQHQQHQQHQQHHHHQSQHHQQQYHHQPLDGHNMAPSHHASSQQGFGMHGQYPPQTHTLPSQQPLGTLASHTSASHGQSAQHTHASANVAQHIDPSLMPRNGIAAQYDISNPVLGGSATISDSQWQNSFQPGAATSELYAGPYVADVEESYLPDNHLQYLQSDEDWRVDPNNDAEDWTGAA